MTENTSPELAAAIAALLAAVGQARPAVPATPQTMLTVREAAEYLCCSESLIYAQMKDGRLRGVKVGRRRLISMRELVRITEGGAAA
ncbi:helix-turn-helix domain-containing protein [Mycobacteroides abscessus]|uniref:helix-turn-helix domain-containing protein n=1 Tax=Mycobacteroides abscessus TaxID=36809 RepID=UPI0009A7E382|nr:helix-turn-helix domain-containing protein [Mycobacteroides abscessus]SKF97927.1 DNA-binding protein [Mycobacteroides abscessus subsp. massiliense]SKH14258.1 DNA-binding protein [Mycobacteroides abscessus subsp. massiliense]SKI02619.1 DNA-binding protein [Mycobacteroides abscessus subsp. massiliense]SKI70456.1 DNA-binding protein [Mycobacteroides abscessus subsp. massiliense]SKJ18187.1 DNA-binding protein [Mycobacteroides abscessus subsp. massiliense]